MPDTIATTKALGVGGASTQVNTVDSGFDAVLAFTWIVSGTHHINTRTFDDVAQDGTDGDMIGDHDLSPTAVTDVPHYVFYYDASSPLYAIHCARGSTRSTRPPPTRTG